MGIVTIRTLTNRDPDFYPSLGPFLSRRSIAAELGGPIWDDDDKTWLVALRDEAVIGFCAYRFRKETALLSSAYVLPDHRGQGIYDRLFSERLTHIGDRAIRATVTSKAASTWRRYGFQEMGTKGRFLVFGRNL